MRDPLSGLGGAGEGDWRSVVAGVLRSDVVAELRGGFGKEDTKGKKLLMLLLPSLKSGVERASRQGARSRLKSSSGEEKLECSSAPDAVAAVIEALSTRSKVLAAAWSQVRWVKKSKS